MASSLFGQLDRSLHDRLGDLVRRAQRGDDDAALNLARVEIPKIITALRALLDEHRPDERGRCLTCRSRRLPKYADWNSWDATRGSKRARAADVCTKFVGI